MKRPATRKCRHCQQCFRPDHHNRHHQRYCSKAACRRRSKAEAQRRWLQKPENQAHFQGPENRQRVKAWRKAHPGYWRKGQPDANRPLQDLCDGQLPATEQLTKQIVPAALQDLFLMQPAVVLGLISMSNRFSGPHRPRVETLPVLRVAKPGRFLPHQGFA